MATAAVPLPTLVAAVRMELPVISNTPPRNNTPRTTMAPAEASRPRNGSPTSAPSQPPARPSWLNEPKMVCDELRTTSIIPRIDSEPTPHPIASR